MVIGDTAKHTAQIKSGRVFAAVVAALLLGYFSYLAVGYGVAGGVSANASWQLERVTRSPGPGSGEWWKDDLRQVASNSRDPTANELLAVAITAATSDPVQLATAQRHLVKAIEWRPGSGYTWANLAMVKYKLGETDSIFEQALVNAMRLAPYEPEVQRDVVNYGLAVMEEVKLETRASIERAIALGMKRNASEILQISARRGKLGAACRHLDGVPRPAALKWTQLCESMEAKS
jgi:hypothetical protein